ncbi:hypothetical protein K2173_017824 [Erythroxylum novogranatense]|uniref:RNase H type-1 domain-containing protein n=1 Tax=Erythroxylum novogranatense TaxID=1862640 RepID=A0AAV8T2X7_9ROSI|nr:hypothetical protein K2173_017824 [Erythroxylum novogranatense]
MLAKIPWHLITAPHTELWSRLLLEKYGNHGVFDFDNFRPACSCTWRSIQRGAEVLDLGFGWRIGDGTAVNFWDATWLGNNLIRAAMENSGRHLPAAQVSDFIDHEYRWNRELLAHVLPRDLAQAVLGVPLPHAPKPDTIIWKLSPTGTYTPCMGYTTLMNFPSSQDAGFSCLWTTPGPAKWGSFLWLARRNRLHTQHLRLMRGISNTIVCQTCHIADETSIHILRDCPMVKALWLQLIPHPTWQAWSTMELLDWIDLNMGCKRWFLDKYPWFIVFAATMWFLWKWRCQILFDADFVNPCFPLNTIFAEVEDMCRIWQLEIATGHWVKLNTDGTSRGNPGIAGYGGLLRDHVGCWLLGFSGNLGVSDTLVAELKTIRQGLHIAWSHGFRHLILETDSMIALTLITTPSSRFDPLEHLVEDIQAFLHHEWSCRLQHCYREGNKCADLLANVGADSSALLHIYHSPPPSLCLQLDEDYRGVAYPRSFNC